MRSERGRVEREAVPITQAGDTGGRMEAVAVGEGEVTPCHGGEGRGALG